MKKSFLLCVNLLFLAFSLASPTLTAAAPGKETSPMKIVSITSPAFKNEEPIPTKNSGEGKDLSPALEWSNLPEGTREVALICDDPDAPTPKPWVHWVMYGLSPKTRLLPEAIPPEDRINNPVPAIQGRNSWGRIGYGGPMPPPGHGWHRYYFKLFALDAELKLAPGLTKEELLNAMKGHILGEGTLMGKYKRR